ncbi:MAG: nodulation protein NfeD [bacterium]|nr:nodulation protein NfeD [candidate division KSB1 bacterium]MDH7559549.1 nodulation protein NfeD [bacterium]
MKRSLLRVLSLLALLLAVSAAASGATGRVHVIKVEGDVNPVLARFIIRHIEKAEKERAECLVIKMDTPGGLVLSTQDIVKGILGADVPVVVYVWPSGGGAVSAGVFITMAAHFAIMAPGTNIGAAHPVGIGAQDTSATMAEKTTNWAAAWMRSIAEKRGRNADWAEKAVRESASITEEEALKKKVVDYVCASLKEVLDTLDGKETEVASGRVTLHTKEATIHEYSMDWRSLILYKISNPTIAYILLVLGIYGIFFELSNPGSVLPGVVGGIFLILAFFALQQLPVRAAGLLLILFAIVLFVLEVKVTSYGVLTIGGIVAMLIGSLMLFQETAMPSMRIDWRVALAAAITTGLFFFFAMGMALKAKMTKPTTGKEGLIGEKGVVVTDLAPEGQVRLHGEIWSAYSDEPIPAGQKIQVVGVDGMSLKVKKFASS